MLSERELSIKVRAVIDDLVNPLKQAGASVEAFGKEVAETVETVEQSTEKMSGLFRAAFEAFIGAEIFEGLKKLAEGANDANEQMEIAANTAKNLGKAFDASNMEAWAEKFAQSAQGGGYAITGMRDAIQQFASVGANGAQIQRLLADTAELAAGRNIDFAQATRLVMYAAAGHIEMLSRYGINVKDANGKTVDFTTAMQRLEKAFSGDAEKRANGLEGALGRLGSTASEAGDKIGNDVAPLIDGMANALQHLLEAFNALPGPVQTFLIDAGLLAGALGIFVTLLPAIAKAFQFVGEGVQLAKGIFAAFTDLLAPMARAINLVRLGQLDLAAAELAGIAPIAAIVAAVAGLIAILVEVVRHLGDFQNAWHDWTTYLGEAWSEFLKNFRAGAVDMKRIIGDVMLAMAHPAQAGLFLQDIAQTAAPASSIKWGAKLGQDDSKLAGDVKRDVSGVWNWIKGFFGSNLGNTPKSDAALDGLGGPTGAGKKKKKAKKGPHVPDGHGEATVYFDDSTPVDNVQQGYDSQIASLNAQLEENRHKKAMAESQGKLTPKASSAFDDEAAKIKEQIALITEEADRRKLLIAQFDYDADHSKKNADALTAAQTNLTNAVNAATKATNERIEADTKAAQAANSDGVNSLNGVLKKLATNVPGVSMNAAGALSFNPWMLLLQAFEQTKSFADIMLVVNRLMKVFAQILDTLRPVIDLLLRAVIAVANGFIDVWNMIAKVLRLFGIHIQTLQKISDAFTDSSAPFIQFIHDIPTMNELASGKVAPLYPSGSDYYTQQNITNPITDQLKDPSLGGGILDMLGQILGAIGAIKLGGNLLGIGGGGGGGGALGSIGKLFSYGGKTGLSGIEAALGGIHIGAATLGSSMLAVAGGAIMGNYVGKLFGGGTHSTFGSIGGALGGGLGATLGMLGMGAGPLGALAGAAIGSILGSVFGHADNPALMPDKYKQQQWGSFLANFGADNGGKTDAYDQTHNQIANGQSFSIDSQIASITNGQGIGAYIAQYLKSGGSTSIFGSDASAISNMFSGWDSRGMHDGKNGNMMIGNQTFNWQNILSEGQTAFQDIVNSLQSGAQQINGALGNVGNTLGGAAQDVVGAVGGTLNDLAGVTKSASDASQVIQQAVTATQGVGAAGSAAGKLAGSMTNHFYGDINGIDDIKQIGDTLAETQLRVTRLSQYRLDRAGGGGA